MVYLVVGYPVLLFMALVILVWLFFDKDMESR